MHDMTVKIGNINRFHNKNCLMMMVIWKMDFKIDACRKYCIKNCTLTCISSEMVISFVCTKDSVVKGSSR